MFEMALPVLGMRADMVTTGVDVALKGKKKEKEDSTFVISYPFSEELEVCSFQLAFVRKLCPCLLYFLIRR